MLRVLLAGLFCFALPFAASAAETGPWMKSNPAPTGLWVTANHDAVIQIRPCGADLCGQIVGIVLKPGEAVPKDWRGDSQCGLTIIQTAPEADNPAWTGSIVDPRNGSVYNARLRLDASHNLLLRGYIGLPILGQTQTWTRYNGAVPTDCRMQAD